MSLKEIISTLKNKGYVVYTEPYRLNIVGIRSSNDVSEKFDDNIAFFYYDNNGNLFGRICPATTDPSVKFLNEPINSAGTAILKSGQYVDAYKIGLHRNKYTALVQQLPVTVIRDSDRNSVLSFSSKTETGMFGINIHRASSNKSDVNLIDADSAGCQVYMNVNDFNEMMNLAQKSKSLYGNNFTYTLIDKVDVIKKARNLILLGVGLTLVGVFGYLYYKKFG